MQIERGISRTYVLQTHILVYRFIWIDCSREEIDEMVNRSSQTFRPVSVYWLTAGLKHEPRKIRRNAAFFMTIQKVLLTKSKLIAMHL